jgi:P27 family predicted phage terminase small subunit
MKNEITLSKRAKIWFDQIKSHAEKLGLEEVDDIEMSMLANEYETYFSAMEFCNEHGYALKMESGYSQIRPEYTVMKGAYHNIVKHSAKFGMTPGDRAKIFGMKNKNKAVKKGFDI